MGPGLERALVRESVVGTAIRAAQAGCGPVLGAVSDTGSMNSRVHSTYKTKYRVTNWREYERGLVQRGTVTVWLSDAAIKAWRAQPSGKRGAQPKFSDLAIETALTVRLVFHLPLRQAEGFLRSIFALMDIDLEAPDHTTLSRRSAMLKLELRGVERDGPINLIVDSTGLSIVGEGEWAAAKHGGKGKRGWEKLHLGVDGAGVLVVPVLTDGNADDAKTGLQVIEAVEDDIASVTADTAYDTVAIYGAAGARGAEVVVPPTRTAVVSRRGPRSTARDRTIERVREIGRRQWKKESGYHRQGTVENAFFRYKALLGDRLRARTPGAQQAEATIASNILNGMLDLGRPTSVAIGS